MLNATRHDDEIALAEFDSAVAEIDGDLAAQDQKRLILGLMRMPIKDLAELGDFGLTVVDVAGDVRIEDLGDLLIRRLDKVLSYAGALIQPFTAATIFLAASSRSSADTTFSPLSLMIFLPSAALVPSSRPPAALSARLP